MKFEKLRDEFIVYLRDIRNYSPCTLDAYKRCLKFFFSYTGSLSPSLLKIEHVWEYRSYMMKKKYHPNTIHYHLIGIRAFLKFCKIKGIKILDFERVDVGRRVREQVEYLTPDEIERLLCAVEVNSVKDLRDKAMIELLCSSGMRISEMLRLNRQDVNEDNLTKRYFPIIGKGRKRRLAFINLRTADALRRYLAFRLDKEEPLFINHFYRSEPGESRRRLGRDGFKLVLRYYAKKAGITEKIVTAHTLRHSFATTLLKKGTDLYTIKELLGHTFITSTQIYLHVENKDLQRAHDKAFN